MDESQNQPADGQHEEEQKLSLRDQISAAFAEHNTID